MGKRKYEPLQIRVRMKMLPANVTPGKMYEVLGRSIDNGNEELPRTWEVLIGYRNPESRSSTSANWQWGSFNDIVDGSESFGAFNWILREFLRREERRWKDWEKKRARERAAREGERIITRARLDRLAMIEEQKKKRRKK